MRDRISMSIAILLLAAIAATSYWYSRVIRTPVLAERIAPGTPDFVVERIALTQFDAIGRAKNKLFAARLTHFAETEDVELEAPRLVSLLPDRPQVEARAATARVDNGGERLHMRGNVVITRAAGPDAPPMQLATEYLLAVPDDDRYSTDQPVEVKRGASTIRARGMVFDNIARTLEFSGGVESSFAADEPVH
jgi:lipopolysaccharide export system protein LptC